MVSNQATPECYQKSTLGTEVLYFGLVLDGGDVSPAV